MDKIVGSTVGVTKSVGEIIEVIEGKLQGVGHTGSEVLEVEGVGEGDGGGEGGS